MNPVRLIEEYTRVNNELCNAQRMLAKKCVELEQIQKERNLLLGVVVHDLRNPLQNMLGMLGILRNEDAEIGLEKRREYLDAMHSSCEFMSRIVSSLLDFSSWSGSESLSAETLELGRFVSETLLLSRHRAQENGIVVSFHDESGGALVGVNRLRLAQVVCNLVDNAIKFSPRWESGSVFVFLVALWKRMVDVFGWIRVSSRGRASVFLFREEWLWQLPVNGVLI